MKTKNRTLENLFKINEGEIRNHLSEIVKGTVEDTLNAYLDSEADQLCNAERYQRREARRDTRAGHYQRRKAYESRRSDLEHAETA